MRAHQMIDPNEPTREEEPSIFHEAEVVTTHTTPIPDAVMVTLQVAQRYETPPVVYAACIQPKTYRRVQRVVVMTDNKRKYTYETDRDVTVGMTVELPTSRHPLLRFLGQVVEIGSEWKGQCKSIAEVHPWPKSWDWHKSFEDTQKALEQVLLYGAKPGRTYHDFAMKVATWGMDEKRREYHKESMRIAMRAAARHLAKAPIYTAEDFYRELEETRSK